MLPRTYPESLEMIAQKMQEVDIQGKRLKIACTILLHVGADLLPAITSARNNVFSWDQKYLKDIGLLYQKYIFITRVAISSLYLKFLSFTEFKRSLFLFLVSKMHKNLGSCYLIINKSNPKVYSYSYFILIYIDILILIDILFK